MSISNEITRLTNAKAAIKQSIVNKGVRVSDTALLDEYPALIDKIEGGGEGGGPNPYQELYMQRTANETNMKGLFSYTPASTILDLSAMNTSKATDMSYMFAECKVPYLDLSGFDTSNVSNMERMFNNCTSEININGWDTSKLTNTNNMFYSFTNKNKYLDLSVLDFSNVTKAQNMFNNCNIDYIDIRNINIDLTKLDWNAYSGSELLNSAEGTTLDLSNWTLDSSMTSLKKLCYWVDCKEVNLTNWKTTNITNMQEMFYYNSNLERLIMPDWDMTNTTNTSSFFYSCNKLNYIDLSRSNDTTIAKIATLVPAKTLAAYGQILIPVDSSQANIEALVAKYWKPIGPRIDMTSTELALELDEIKPGKTTKLYYGNPDPWYGNDVNVEYVSSDEFVATIDEEAMTITSTGIEGTTEITARIVDTQEVISEPITLVVSEEDHYQNIIKFRTVSVPNSNNYITVNGSQVKINTMNYNSISSIYTYDAGAPITHVNFPSILSEVIKLNTSNVTNMSRMFYNCYNLTLLDLSNWDTSNVTNMNNMFYNCSKLTTLDVSNWDTNNVTNMCSMFEDCNRLKSLDLSSFDTRNITDIDYMFRLCNDLEELDIRKFDLTKMAKSVQLFQGCDKLHTIRLDNCDKDTIRKIITSGLFPTNKIPDVTRKIYCKKAEAAGLTEPKNWVFEFVD